VGRSSSLPPSSLSGNSFPSEVQPGVRYVLERHVGEGGMGRAYLARREAPDGTAPVVIKVVAPNFGDGTVSAELVAQKEAVALGRLNERVPPCPFVVRFIDTGNARIGGRVAPWLALEYVHGGVEGTTLEDRVAYSIHQTEYAFDPVRAGHAIRCLSAGLAAIHGVGVIHRDLTPGNVLCCGFGETEMFKISDFGLARPEGLGRTFAGLGIGTVGYAAPEQSVNAEVGIGPFTDVFAFACVVYFLLTGEHYFEGPTPIDAFEAIKGKPRASVLAARALSPELRDRPDACRAIDAALARASSFQAELRPQTAEELAAAVLPWLGEAPSGPRSSRRLMETMMGVPAPTDLSGWTWVVKHRPRDDLVIQGAAWDIDGHCFAFTPRGPLFWNGHEWVGATSTLSELPRGMTFARRAEAGGWLVGGAAGTLAIFGSEGLRDVVHAPWPGVEFIDGCGMLDDLVTAVARRPGMPLELHAMCGRRWLRPLPLDGVQSVTALVRLDDARYLVGGRLARGSAFAAIYSPTMWELEPLAVPDTRSIMSGASNPERELALLVGSEGIAVRVDSEGALSSRVQGAPDLSASALDVLDREWAASLGTLWTRAALGEAWCSAWADASWRAPFVSVMADSGLVVAMTVNGGIVEGRSMAGPRMGRVR
jgi:eukaryotic-like serine/threonine-protein kinase